MKTANGVFGRFSIAANSKFCAVARLGRMGEKRQLGNQTFKKICKPHPNRLKYPPLCQQI